MLSREQGIDHTAEAGSERSDRRLGLGSKMARFGPRQVELASKIRQGHVEITHGHLGRSVAE